MSRKSEVAVTWTCDVCGLTEPEVGGYAPRGWQQVASAAVSAQLGWDPLESTCRHASLSIL